MRDSCNRNIDYLRISVTDRCNLRCIYCMPESGIEFLPHEQILSYEEILRICREMAKLGLRKVKLTGGEPLVRKDLPQLVSQLKQIEGIQAVTVTTNGVLLESFLPELTAAGLDAVNISLDTLDPEEYYRVTRFHELDRVLRGIDAALSAPSHLTVKLNCVPIRTRDCREQIIRLTELARRQPLHVRFIELMPIGLGEHQEGFSEPEIRMMIEQHYGPLRPYQGTLGNGPSAYYELDGFQGKIGFISAISHKFCHECNRVRLTSDGFLKTCLQYGEGIDLKRPVKDGVTDEQLLELIRTAVYHKPAAHQFGTRAEQGNIETNIMSQIGG